MENPKKQPTTTTTTDYVNGGGCILFAILIYAFIFFICFGLTRLPQHQTLEFRLESFSTAPITFSPPSRITANWNITFSLRKLSSNLTAIFYDDVHTSIYYKEVLLSKAEMDSIYLSEDNEWVPVAAVISAKSVGVEKWVAYAIVADRDRKGAVRFNVKVEARVLLNPGTKSMRNGSVSVYCEDVEAIVSIVRLSNEYAINGASKICALNLTKDTPHVLQAVD